MPRATWRRNGFFVKHDLFPFSLVLWRFSFGENDTSDPQPPSNGERREERVRKEQRVAKRGGGRLASKKESRDGDCCAQRCVAWQRTGGVLPGTWEEPGARPTVAGNSEQGSSRRESNSTKRQGRQVCQNTTRKVANRGEREAELKKRFDVKQTELTGSITRYCSKSSPRNRHADKAVW